MTKQRPHTRRVRKTGTVYKAGQGKVSLITLKKNAGIKYLFHKTEGEKAMQIINSENIKNPYSRDPISFSELSNPYIWNLKLRSPVVLVFKRADLEDITRIDYSKANKANNWAVDHNDRRSWMWEKEWYTWSSPTYPALIGVILNERYIKTDEEPLTMGKDHGHVAFSQPTRYIPISKVKKKDLIFDLKAPADDYYAESVAR